MPVIPNSSSATVLFFPFSPAVSSADSIVMRFPHVGFLFSQVNEF